MEVGQISAKHRRALQEVEGFLMQQTKISENLKLDLERSRAELASKSAKNQELENSIRQRDATEKQLRAELQDPTSASGIGLASSSSIRSPVDEGYFDPRTPSLQSALGVRSVDEGDSYRTFATSNSPVPDKGPQTSSDLLRRLADSQRALFHILETNKASPHVSHTYATIVMILRPCFQIVIISRTSLTCSFFPSSSHQNDPIFQRPINVRFAVDWQPVIESETLSSVDSSSYGLRTAESPFPPTSGPQDAGEVPVRKQQSTPPVHQSGSPGRNTFDIDSPEMRKFITRGKKPDGIPVTNLQIGFGVTEKKLVELAKSQAVKAAAGHLLSPGGRSSTHK